MASSTWPRGFSDRGHLLPAVGTVFGAPAVWFAMLQVGYAQSYSACTGGTHAWLHGITLGAAALQVVMAAAGWQRWRAWHEASARDRFLAALAVIFPLAFLLLALGSWIPVVVLHPCD